MTFGEYIREHREALKSEDRRFPSGRSLSESVWSQPFSKIERGMGATVGGKNPGIGRGTWRRPDVLLAMAGKVSSDLQEIIRKRPQLFADLIRQLKSAPDHAFCVLPGCP